jgi:hypothetical protein
MKPQQQHRADQLEELLSSHSDQNMSAQMQSGVSDGVDPEVREMARLAQHLQASPSLMPDPVFVQRLERKVLVHSLQTRRGMGDRKGSAVRKSLPAHWFGSLVKGKVLVATLVGAVLFGSMGVALAATHGGQDIVQNLPGAHATASPTLKPEKDKVNHGTATTDANKQGQKGDVHACASLTEAQQLAAKFSLSTDTTGSAVQVICALHDGTFHTIVGGKTLTTDRALGYGEVNLLLTHAQALAVKDGTKLADGNVQKYITTILNTCGSTPVMPCIKNNTGGNERDNGGKPTSIPTPHVDGKPTSIPTPHADG